METRINDHNIRRQIYSYLSIDEKEAIQAIQGFNDLVLYKSLIKDHRGENIIIINLDADTDKLEDDNRDFGYAKIVVKRNGSTNSFTIELKKGKNEFLKSLAESFLHEEDELEIECTQFYRRSNAFECNMRSTKKKYIFRWPIKKIPQKLNWIEKFMPNNFTTK